MNRFSDILLPSLLSTATLWSGTLMIMSLFFILSLFVSFAANVTAVKMQCNERRDLCSWYHQLTNHFFEVENPTSYIRSLLRTLLAPFALSPCHFPHIEIGELVYVHKKRAATYSHVLASDAINPSHVRWFLSRPIYSIPTNPDENFFLHSFWARKTCSTV